MQRLLNLTVFLLFLGLAIPGCKPSDEEAKTRVEHISYKVNYLDAMAGDIPTKMLPDVMNTYYSRKYIKTSISGFFGQFSLEQIANLKKNTVTTMLSFFGSKVYYEGLKGEIPAGIVALKNPECIFTDDTLSISGVLSKKAIITTGNTSYDIYYTDLFDIKSPNITTPYNFIDHILTDFRVQLSILKMRLIMEKHQELLIDENEFSVPEDYEAVSKVTMENIINNLFTKD